MSQYNSIYIIGSASKLNAHSNINVQDLCIWPPTTVPKAMAERRGTPAALAIAAVIGCCALSVAPSSALPKCTATRLCGMPRSIHSRAQAVRSLPLLPIRAKPCMSKNSLIKGYYIYVYIYIYIYIYIHERSARLIVCGQRWPELP